MVIVYRGKSSHNCTIADVKPLRVTKREIMQKTGKESVQNLLLYLREGIYNTGENRRQTAKIREAISASSAFIY